MPILGAVDWRRAIVRSLRHMTLSPLALDAWGTPVVVQRYSLFHSLFTANVPPELWLKYINGVEVLDENDTVDFFSEDKKLVVTNISGDALLESRRHPRYQPDRGHRYSNSMFLPTPDANATRQWGFLHDESGAFFELTNGVLYAVVRTTVGGVTSEHKEPLKLPKGFDNPKGNTYDIQMQWRGVGDIRFFVGDVTTRMSTLVYTYKNLGTNTQLSISNPTLPAAYKVFGTDVVRLESGCVDISSEGGQADNLSFASVDSEEVNVTNTETPIIALRVPETVLGQRNTRDCLFRRVSAYANDDALVRVYYTRNPAAITTTWIDKKQGFQQYAVNGNITAFNTSLMERVKTKRCPAGDSIDMENPARSYSDFILVHGDMVLVTIQAKNNVLGGASIDYDQEV